MVASHRSRPRDKRARPCRLTLGLVVRRPSALLQVEGNRFQHGFDLGVVDVPSEPAILPRLAPQLLRVFHVRRQRRLIWSENEQESRTARLLGFKRLGPCSHSFKACGPGRPRPELNTRGQHPRVALPHSAASAERGVREDVQLACPEPHSSISPAVPALNHNGDGAPGPGGRPLFHCELNCPIHRVEIARHAVHAGQATCLLRTAWSMRGRKRCRVAWPHILRHSPISVWLETKPSRWGAAPEWRHPIRTRNTRRARRRRADRNRARRERCVLQRLS